MLILGSGFQHRGGAILLYRSSDLRHWTYLHTLVEKHGKRKRDGEPGRQWRDVGVPGLLPARRQARAPYLYHGQSVVEGWNL